MSIADLARAESEALIRALIEEARQRARRRRSIYGVVLLSLAIAGAIVFASFQRPAQTQSISPAAPAGASAPSTLVGKGAHIEHGLFTCKGKRGILSIGLGFRDSGTRSWGIRGGDLTGQYVEITASGKGFKVGGRGSAWNARLVGFVARPGAPKQRVVIVLKGRPRGVFVLTPLEPGILKRDSGTQRSGWLG
jgi:hypothetical protein